MSDVDFDKLHNAFASAVVACLDEIIRTGDTDGWLEELKSCAVDGAALIEVARRAPSPDGWSP